MSEHQVVESASELLDAVNSDARVVEVRGTITGMPMVTLEPGVTLCGGTLQFGAKGVRLTSENTLEDICIRTVEDEVAILNDTSVADLGTLALRGVTTAGQVLLVAQDAVRAAHVLVDGLHIERADVRGRDVRPHGFGVEALQGAFTLWNRHADPAIVISAELRAISAGSPTSPIRGSGIFVGGHGDWQGEGLDA